MIGLSLMSLSVYPMTYEDIRNDGIKLGESAKVYEVCDPNTFAHTDGTDIYICESKLLKWFNENGVTDKVDTDAGMRIVLTHEMGHILFQHAKAQLILAHAKVNASHSRDIKISFEKEADDLAFTVNAKSGTLKACEIFSASTEESSTHPSDFSRREACRQLFIGMNPSGKI